VTEADVPTDKNAVRHGLISSPPPSDGYEYVSEKARQLLQTVLPKELWFGLKANDVLQFTGRRGTYLILPNSQTKIYDADGYCVAYACLQLSIAAPDYDRMLAEYLLLKNDENCYWQTANIFAPASDVVVLLLSALDFCLFTYFLMILRQ
jgi:hypothetical protein